jgi:hypothetical protein
MSRISKTTLAIAGLWFLAFELFVARPSVVTQFASMLLTLALLVFGFISCIRVFTQWRRERWFIFLPLGACALAIVLAPEVGGAIRQLIFQRSLPHYEAIIRQMHAGEIPISDEWRRVPEAEGGSAYAVFAQRSTNNVLTVEFLTGGGFPVKHSGYLYCSSGVIEKSSLADRHWPRRSEIQPLWFRVSD